jgi:hypothetical protein
MVDEQTYLELSEGGSHKFHEVKAKGATLTVRHGRIGGARVTGVRGGAGRLLPGLRQHPQAGELT